MLALFLALFLCFVSCDVTGDSNTVKCTICEKLVGYVEEYLQKADNSTEIKQKLEDWCHTLPSVVQEPCLTFVDEYLDKVIEYIEDKYPAKEVCELIGFCPKPVLTGELKCTICVKLVDYVEEYLKDADNSTEIKQKLKQFCGTLPALLKTPCETFVDQYLDNVIKYLTENYPAKKVCQLINMCPEKINLAPKLRTKNYANNGRNTMECTICTEVVTYVEQYLQKEENSTEIKKELEAFCKTLPSLLQGICTTFVDQYLDEIIKYLEDDYPPKKVCELLEMCKPEEEIVTGAMECTICVEVCNLVETYVKKEENSTEIQKELEAFCKTLPSLLQGICTTFVDQYLSEIIKYLEDDYPPKKVCQLLDMCPQNEKKLNGAIECTICTEVVNLIEEYVKKEENSTEIKKELEAFCKTLPSLLTGICTTFVDQYLDEIISYLEDDYPPKKVCELLDMCTEQRVKQTVTGAMECTICVEVCNLVETYVKKEENSTEIQKELEAFCKTLPSLLQGICTTFVDQYLSEIIKYLEDDYPPKKVCQLLDMCPQKLKMDEGAIECTICVEVVNLVEEYVKKEENSTEIQKELEAFCKTLPSLLEGICTTFVDQYLSEIIKYLEDDYPPKKVCQLLDMCTQKVKLRGAIECTICTEVVSLVEEYVKKEENSTEIKKELEAFCKTLPSLLTGICTTFVDQYLDEIISYLEDDYPPKKVCQLLDMCTENARPTPPPPVNDECTMCKEVVDYIESALKKNATEAEIADVLKDLCGVIPDKSLGDKCKSIIDLYLPRLVGWVEKYTAEECCEFMHMCS